MFLCESCVASLSVHQEQHCPQCQSISALGAVCESCRNKPEWALDGLFVIAPYCQKSLLQTCIKTMKYGAAHRLGVILGDWMAWHTCLPGEFVILPVPLHPLRERKRGYNQAQLLANRVAKQNGLTVSAGLKRLHNTEPQAQLNRNDRLKNLLNSFESSENPAFANKKVVLVDDVCSTGATLNECAKALRQKGVQNIWGLVLARG